MRSYKAIQTLSLVVRPGFKGSERWWSCRFPDEVRPRLEGLQLRRSSKEAASAFPIRSLNSAIAALVPGVIEIKRGVGAPGYEGVWFWSCAIPDGELLALLMQSWIRAEFECNKAQQIAGSIDHDRFSWNEDCVDVGAWTQLENGTADPTPGNHFAALAHYLASRLADPSMEFTYGGSQLTWRRELAPWENRARLVSWPAFEIQKNSYVDRFSIGLDLSVQTLPWVGHPQIFANLGLRRWVSRPITGGDGRAVTVLLAPDLPNRSTRRREFQTSRIKRRWDFKVKRHQWVWADNLSAVLNDFNEVHGLSIPDAERLAMEPDRWRPGRARPSALIAYRHGLRPRHAAEAGWGPYERRRLFEDVIAKQLEPWAQMADVCGRVQIKTPSTPGDDRLREAIWSRTGQDNGHIELQLWNQTSEARDMLRSAGAELLDTVAVDVGRSGWAWRRNGREINATVLALHDVGYPLESTKQEAMRQRALAVQARLTGEQARGLIVELDDRERFEAGRDPKFAIRRGAALAGLLTQFITPCDRGREEVARHRMKAALLDLGRQLGAHNSTDSWWNDVTWLAIWMIRRTSITSYDHRPISIPIAVRMRPLAGPELRGPMGPWLPYGQGLLQLVADCDPFAGIQMDSTQCQERIAMLIDEELQLGKSTVLLSCAQNIRSHWPQARNKSLVRDEVHIGSRQWKAASAALLRHVRIRTVESSESPEWYGKAEDAVGLPAGLWSIPYHDRLYYSIHRRPKSGAFPLGLSKVEPWLSSARDLKPPRPGGRVFNQQLVEILIAMKQRDDDASELAGAVHQLRAVASHYKEAMVLPLPLHLCELAREYVLADIVDSSVELDTVEGGW